MLGVVTCTCNPTNLEVEFQNGVTTCNLAQGDESD